MLGAVCAHSIRAACILLAARAGSKEKPKGAACQGPGRSKGRSKQRCVGQMCRLSFHFKVSSRSQRDFLASGLFCGDGGPSRVCLDVAMAARTSLMILLAPRRWPKERHQRIGPGYPCQHASSKSFSSRKSGSAYAVWRRRRWSPAVLQSLHYCSQSEAPLSNTRRERWPSFGSHAAPSSSPQHQHQQASRFRN